MAITQQISPERLPLGGLSPIGSGKIDEASGVIRDVCIATSGVPVEGHGFEDEASGEFVQFWADQETLESMLACALSVGEPLKAKLEHGTGLREIIGTYSNWRIDGEKLLADFAAAPTCEAETRNHIFWMAKTMPSQFGVSVTAVFTKRRSGLSAFLRCTELRSADFVDEPAINASLFSKNAGQASPLNSKQEEEIMNEEQLKKLKAEIRAEVATENKEAIAEAIKEALPGIVEEVVAASKLSAEEEKPEEKTEAEEKPDDEKLEKQELSKSIAAAVAKAVRGELVSLGLSKGAKVQGEGSGSGGSGASGKTYEAEMSAKAASGKRFHVALSELERENPDLVRLECKRLGVPSSAYLVR